MGRIGPEGEQRRNSFEYQEQFLLRAASESHDRDDARVINGPFAGDFNSIFNASNAGLKAIDPTLPYGALLLDEYQSPETTAQIESLSDFQKAKLESARQERSRLVNNLTLSKITGRLAGQEIPQGLLVKPKFRRMPYATGKCTNACFRMVSSDILGWDMQEDLVEQAVLHEDEERVVPDKDYWNLLRTDAFTQEAGHEVSVASFLGADLDTIAKFAGIVKERHPEARVYCVASIRGKSPDREDTSHRVVLLNATQGGVFVHDPAWRPDGNMGDNFPMQKFEFTKRWAAANNSGLFVVA